MIRSPLAADFLLSPNVGARRGQAHADMLILHYTGMKDARQACAWLCNPASHVSCHYLVDETGRIIQMVGEEMRAWHAGVASWRGGGDINSCSIGIEIHNPGHHLGYDDFPQPQMAAVIALCRDIGSRHDIKPRYVLAHSDVAPLRKIDPGEKFDWRQLHAGGIGQWVAPAATSDGPILRLGDAGEKVLNLQTMLAAYGYAIALNGTYDTRLVTVVSAFQRHFRPNCVNGIADVSTVQTLDRLLASL